MRLILGGIDGQRLAMQRGFLKRPCRVTFKGLREVFKGLPAAFVSERRDTRVSAKLAP